MRPKTNYSPWNFPDYDEIYWFNEAAERATIKSIMDGTSSARSWSDLQGTWGYSHLRKQPKPRVIRVEKVKPKYVRVKKEKQFRPHSLNRTVYILTTNGMPLDEAVETAMKLLTR